MYVMSIKGNSQRQEGCERGSDATEWFTGASRGIDA